MPISFGWVNDPQGERPGVAWHGSIVGVHSVPKLYILLFLLSLPFTLRHLVAPLGVWTAVKVPAQVSFEAWAEAAFLADRSGEFQTLDRQLRLLGLVYQTASQFQNSGTTSCFAIYAHPESRTMAALTEIKTNAQQVTYVELSRQDRSGFIISVQNSAQISVYPRMPQLKVTLQYPQEWDLRELWRRLDRLQQHRNLLPAPLPLGSEDFLNRIATFMEQESEVLVQLGYCRAVVNADGRRSLTLKGAYWMSWKLLFPGKQLQTWLNKRYAQPFCQ